MLYEVRLPPIRVLIYQEDDGGAPLLDWLDTLKAKARDNCTAKIVRLAQLGHELRRPITCGTASTSCERRCNM